MERLYTDLLGCEVYRNGVTARVRAVYLTNRIVAGYSTPVPVPYLLVEIVSPAAEDKGELLEWPATSVRVTE
jgi:Uma2 family endonuclease